MCRLEAWMKFVIVDAYFIWHFNNCVPMKIHLTTGFRQEVTLKIIPQIVRCVFYLSCWFSFDLALTDGQFQISLSERKRRGKKNHLSVEHRGYCFLFLQCSVCFSLNIWQMCFWVFGHPRWNFIPSKEQKKCVYSKFTYDGSLREVGGAVVFSLQRHKSCLC